MSMKCNITNDMARSIHPPLRRVSRISKDNVQMHTKNASNYNYDTSRHFMCGGFGEVNISDSSYSSCSEDSHSSLSREPSDALKTDNGLMRHSMITSFHMVEFATKLGYTEQQLEIVLEKLGRNAGQDEILSELIKLGRKYDDDNINLKPQVSTTTTSMLRSIVIDGSNIAITHGRKEVFSCLGIRECVQFFKDRGHTDIIVFVPQFRREAPRSDCPITDQHILFELDDENILVWTPSRRIGGRRIVCHDDRYILKTAEEKDAVIVSNDEYRDLIKESPQYRRLVEQRLLMYSFVDGRFMPPDDPLGRHGPNLTQFLCRGNVQQPTAQLCPYARKCTYGNKCKYFHPERPNGVHISVTERLLKGKQQRKQFLSARPSLPCDSLRDRPTNLHSSVVRTRSLNIPLRDDASTTAHNRITEITTTAPITPTIAASTRAVNEMSFGLLNDSTSIVAVNNPLIDNECAIAAPQRSSSCNNCTKQCSKKECHRHCRNMSSSNNNCDQSLLALSLSSLQLSTKLCPTTQINTNTAINTTILSPLSSSTNCSESLLSRQSTGEQYLFINNYFNPTSSPCCVVQSTSSILPSQLSGASFVNDVGQQFKNTSYLFAPSTAVWGESELRVGPLIRYQTEQTSNHHCAKDDRERLCDLLCHLFPEASVLAVMEAHPNETDPQILCARIIDLQKGFNL